MTTFKHHQKILTGLAILSTMLPMKTKGQDLHWEWHDELPSLEEEFPVEKTQKEESELECGTDMLMDDGRSDPRYADRRMKQLGGFGYDGGFTAGIIDCYWSGDKKDQDFDKLNPGKWKMLCENLSHNSPVVRRPPLNGYNFTTNQVDELLTALHENRNVEYLDLKNTSLRPVDMGRLLFAVKNNPNLKGLDLSGNSMLGYNIEQIGAFLRENKTLQSLFLGNPRWYWRSLEGEQKEFTDIESVRPLADALRQNKTLKCLSLQGWNMSLDATKALFSALKKNKNIETLDLQGAFYKENKDQVAGLIADFLASDPPLKNLSIWGCDLPKGTGARIAKALEKNTHLQMLYANGNNFGSEDYRAFANMLPKNDTFQELRSDGAMDKGVLDLFANNWSKNFSFMIEDFFIDSKMDYNQRNRISYEQHFNACYQGSLNNPKATKIEYVNRDTCSPMKQFVFDNFMAVKTYLKTHPDKKVSDYLKSNYPQPQRGLFSR